MPNDRENDPKVSEDKWDKVQAGIGALAILVTIVFAVVAIPRFDPLGVADHSDSDGYVEPKGTPSDPAPQAPSRVAAPAEPGARDVEPSVVVTSLEPCVRDGDMLRIRLGAACPLTDAIRIQFVTLDTDRSHPQARLLVNEASGGRTERFVEGSQLTIDTAEDRQFILRRISQHSPAFIEIESRTLARRPSP